MIQLIIENSSTIKVVRDSHHHSKPSVVKYLHLTAEEKDLVRNWIARAEALTNEKPM